MSTPRLEPSEAAMREAQDLVIAIRTIHDYDAAVEVCVNALERHAVALAARPSDAVRRALEFARDFKVTDSNGFEVEEDSLHEIRKRARAALSLLLKETQNALDSP